MAAMKFPTSCRRNRRRAPHDTLPEDVYGVDQVRALDRRAIEADGVPGYELMCRAGRAALRVVREFWPRASRLVVVCGSGNNAGDGYVLARLAARGGYAVRVLAVGDPGKLTGDASLAWRDCAAASVPIAPFTAQAGDGVMVDTAADVIVDALLGTGISRPLSEACARAVSWINAAGCPVLALDVPSGLNADSGQVLGDVVRATVTITFVGLKAGLFLGAGPDVSGRLRFDGLGVGPGAGPPLLRRLCTPLITQALPARRRSAHKGDHGRLLLVGGGPGMPGAIRLAAEAALRSGAGRVTVATHPENRTAITAARPEIICHAVKATWPEAAGPAEEHDSGGPRTGAQQLDALIADADVVVLGPGLGTGAWSTAMFRHVVAAARPLVLDADGLNMLATHGAGGRSGLVLTPHPGEAGRLLGVSSAQVQADRMSAVCELATRFTAVVVLKGACTLIAIPAAADGSGSGAGVWVCDRGNPGMACAGMGDVLTGVIGGLGVQLRDLALATRIGVLAHALAGDEAARRGQRGTLAMDLMQPLRRWLNP